jgi:hypothetical protein
MDTISYVLVLILHVGNGGVKDAMGGHGRIEDRNTHHVGQHLTAVLQALVSSAMLRRSFSLESTSRSELKSGLLFDGV